MKPPLRGGTVLLVAVEVNDRGSRLVRRGSRGQTPSAGG